MKNIKAFTLIELIVVITILVLLGTISFISFQGYSSTVRDTVRLSNLKIIESGLVFSHVSLGNFRQPDDAINITASGTVIRKQGFIGKEVLNTIRVSKGGNIDPQTNKQFDYIVSGNGQNYQLGAFFENKPDGFNDTPLTQKNAPLIGKTHAADPTFYTTIGKELGVVFIDNQPAHWNDTPPAEIDIRNTTEELTIKFSDNDNVTSSDGGFLFSNTYNRNRDLLEQPELAKLDPYLIIMIDTDSITPDGKFRDYSINNNHLTCKDSENNDMSCLDQNNEEGWREGSAMRVTGGSWMGADSSPSLTLTKDDSFTYFITVKFFNEYKAPLVIGDQSALCNTDVIPPDVDTWANSNFIFSKLLSYNLWFRCDAVNNNYGTFRIADTIGAGHNFSLGTNYKKNTWYNLVATFNSQDNYKQKGYVNGRLLGEFEGLKWKGQGNNTKEFTLGLEKAIDKISLKKYSRSEFIVDDFRIYNRTLSPKELEKMYDLYINK